MKVKYYAMAALALWLCVVAWVSAMIVAKPTVFSASAAEDDSAAVAQLQQNINHNREMHIALTALAATSAAYGSGPVVTPDSSQVPGLDPGAGLLEGAVLAVPELSMIISTDRSRRAVVDGQLVGTGSRLRDGSRVSGIGDDWVRLRDADGRVLTLRVPGPFASASSKIDP